MGLIRGTIIFTLTVLLFISLFAVNIFLTLSSSVNYNNVEPYMINITQTSALNSGSSATALQEIYQKKAECKNSTSVNFTFEGSSINIPCQIISSGEKPTIDYLVNQTAKNEYYKNYTCSFIECVKNDPSALISQMAKEYWDSELRTMILLSLAIFGLLFLFSKEKHNAFIVAGIASVLSSIPFRQINWLISLISEFLPFRILPAFFSSAPAVSNLMLIIGIILIFSGVAFGFFKWGIKIGSFIESILKKMKKEEKKEEEADKVVTKGEVEKIVKEDIKKEMKKDVDEKVEKEVKLDVKKDVPKEVKKEIKEDANAKVKEDIKKEITKDAKENNQGEKSKKSQPKKNAKKE